MKEKTTAQTLLDSVRETKSQIARLGRKIEVLQAHCQRLTASYGPKAGRGGQSLEDVWCQLAEEKERLTQQLRLFLALERKVEALIDGLPKDRWRMVLRYRYLDGLTFPEVAGEMALALGRELSEVQVYRFHKQAVEALEELRVES